MGRVSAYLSGPARRPEGWGRGAFSRAARELRAAGAVVFDPGEAGPPGADAARPRALRDLHELTSWWKGGCAAGLPVYDLLVSLPGWEGSGAARLERAVAETCGIECVTLEGALERAVAARAPGPPGPRRAAWGTCRNVSPRRGRFECSWCGDEFDWAALGREPAHCPSCGRGVLA